MREDRERLRHWKQGASFTGERRCISLMEEPVMTIRRFIVASAAVVVALAGVSATRAESGFSPRSIRGVYGISGSGTLANGTRRAAVVGLNRFDGRGGCDVKATLNVGGTSLLEPAFIVNLTTASCSYAVNPDGTASLDVTFNEPPFSGPFHSDFVIVDDANELDFVLSDPIGSTVASGISRRQSRIDE